MHLNVVSREKSCKPVLLLPNHGAARSGPFIQPSSSIDLSAGCGQNTPSAYCQLLRRKRAHNIPGIHRFRLIEEYEVRRSLPVAHTHTIAAPDLPRRDQIRERLNQ